MSEFFPWLTQGKYPWHAWLTMTETPRRAEDGRRGRKRRYRYIYEKIRSKKWKWIPWHSVWLAWKSVDLRRKYTRRTQDKQKQTFLLFSKDSSFHDVLTYVRTYVWGRQKGREPRILNLSTKLSPYTLEQFIRPALYRYCLGSSLKGHQCNFHF